MWMHKARCRSRGFRFTRALGRITKIEIVHAQQPPQPGDGRAVRQNRRGPLYPAQPCATRKGSQRWGEISRDDHQKHRSNLALTFTREDSRTVEPPYYWWTLAGRMDFSTIIGKVSSVAQSLPGGLARGRLLDLPLDGAGDRSHAKISSSILSTTALPSPFTSPGYRVRWIPIALLGLPDTGPHANVLLQFSYFLFIPRKEQHTLGIELVPANARYHLTATPLFVPSVDDNVNAPCMSKDNGGLFSCIFPRTPVLEPMRRNTTITGSRLRTSRERDPLDVSSQHWLQYDKWSSGLISISTKTPL